MQLQLFSSETYCVVESWCQWNQVQGSERQQHTAMAGYDFHLWANGIQEFLFKFKVGGDSFSPVTDFHHAMDSGDDQ